MGKLKKDKERDSSRMKKAKKKSKKKEKRSNRKKSRTRSRSRSSEKRSSMPPISKYSPKNFEELRAGILEYLNSSLMAYPVNISRFYSEYKSNYASIPQAQKVMNGLEIDEVLIFIADR